MDDGLARSRVATSLRVDVSLVVCTRNRAQQLARFLDVAARLTPTAGWELVVVDNGSTDDTAQVLEWSVAFLPQLRVVREPIAGLGRARNAGVRCSQGSLIAFVDDDCYPARDHLEWVRAVFDANADVGFVAGRVLRHDRRDAHLTMTTRRRPFRIRPWRFVPAGRIHGANLSFRREALESIGGFDNELGVGTGYACEDVEAVARASWCGIPGLFHPGPTVYHDHGRRTRREVLLARRAYDAGRGAYYARFLSHPTTRAAYARAWLVRAVAHTVIHLSPARTVREVRAARSSRRLVRTQSLGLRGRPS